MLDKIKEAVAEYEEDFDTTGADLVKLDLLGKGFSDQEADEVIEVLASKGKTKPKRSAKPKADTEEQTIASESLNSKIADNLKTFNYENLEGEQLAKYYELLESLPHGELFDFEVYKVKVIRQERFEGVPNSPIDVVGIVLESTKPIITTRVYPKTAIAQNGRLVRGRNYFEIIGQQFHENKLFYLLKK